MTKKDDNKTESTDVNAAADEVVKGAESKAKEIIAEAEAKAKGIVDSAEEKGVKIIEAADEEAADIIAGAKPPKKSPNTKDGVALKRCWQYLGGEGKIFEEGEVIPEGYTDRPNTK